MRYFYHSGHQAQEGDKVYISVFLPSKQASGKFDETRHYGVLAQIIQPFSKDADKLNQLRGGCMFDFPGYMGKVLMDSIDEDIELCAPAEPPAKENYRNSEYFYETGERVLTGDKILVDELYVAFVAHKDAQNIYIHFVHDGFDNGSFDKAKWHYRPFFDKSVKLLRRADAEPHDKAKI